jgi:hypothetical protein
MQPLPSGNREGQAYEQAASDQIAYSIGSRALSKGGLQVGTSTTTSVRLNNSLTFSNGGLLFTKAAAEVAFPVAGNSGYTGANDVPFNAALYTERVYQVCINQAGTLSIVAGALMTATSFVTGSGVGIAPLPEYPNIASGLTPIGSVRITVAPNSSGGFQAGTTSPTTSGNITVQYLDGYPMPLFAIGQ